jgi:predicted RNA-binding Zn-ribbon protein involved in translation (DUF1610 family)
MQCIYTTYDLLEGHIIVLMLRENDIEAWLFNADFVRQNWLQSIAYGGYRIMATDSSVGDALALIQNYKSGSVALEADASDVCPRCGSQEIKQDLQPRRNVFLFLIAQNVLAFPFLLMQKMSVALVFTWIMVVFLLNCFLLALLPMYFKSRYRCTNCGNHWKAHPRVPYSELARQADAGDAA